MKALFRLMSFLCAVAAFVLLVLDGTTMIASQGIEFISVADIVSRFVEPGSMERWQGQISRLHPLVWQACHAIFLSVPALLMVSLLSLAFWAMGRDGEPDLDLRRR